MHLHVFSSPESFRPGFLKAIATHLRLARNSPNGLFSFVVMGMLLLLAGCGAGVLVAPQSASGTASLQISPGTLNFGDVAVGQTAKSTVAVANPGTQAIVVAQIDVPSSAFSNTSGQSFPMTIPGGSTRTLQMGFSPSAATDYSGQIALLDANKKAIGHLPAQGRGMSNAPVATSSPQLTLSASQMNFGSVTVNGSSAQTVTLSSTGTAPVTVSTVVVSGTGFAVSGTNLPITLNPNQTVLLEIKFNPAAAGSIIGQLTVQSDSANGATATVALSGAGTTAPTPQLTASVAALNFGSLVANSSSSQSITLTSTGTAPVTISSAVVSGGMFSTSNRSLPATLQPGQSMALPVLFAPSSVGTANGQLTIFSDSSDGGATVVSLSGMSTAVPAPQLTVSSGNLNFGSNTVNSSSTQTLTLTSTGTAPVTVTSTAATGAGFSVAGIALPITLSPGQSMVAQVKFSPATLGTLHGQLAVVSDSTGGTAVVGLLGTSTAAPVAKLTASLTSLSFGSITVNTSSTQSLTLSSSGTAAVTVSSISALGSGFSIVGALLPVTLAPGQSITVQAKFSPLTAGAAAGQLTVGSDSADGAILVGLNGTGTAAPVARLTASAGALSFGSTTVNTSSTQSLTLTSSGTAAVTVSSISATGTGFSIVGGGNGTLQPGQSMTVQAKFSPSATGAVSGQLSIGSDSSGGVIVVALSGSGTSAPSPLLAVGAGSLGFGNTTVNTTSSQSLTLNSTGTASVTVNSIVASGTGFSVVGAVFPMTLQPGQSMSVQVQFSPATTGAMSGQLIINSNSSSGSTATVALNGTGAAAPVSQLTVSASALSFGNVTVNTSATQTLSLASTGTAAVTVNSATISGAGFAVVSGSLPVTLNPGQSTTLQVRFSPTTTGTASGQITISSNSTTGGTAIVALSGTSVATPAPQLSVGTTTLSFGSVAVNASTTQTLALSSTGTASVTINSATISGAGFAIVGASLPVTLNPGQTMALQIQFSPATTGSASGQLTINSNSSSGSTATVALNGTGTAAPNPQLTVSPGSLSFGNVTVNATSVQSLTLTSTGTSPVTVNSAAISGAGFSIVAGTFPVTLNPNQSLTLQVQYLPTAAGVSTGQLTIISNATSGSTINLVLNGTGMAANPQLTVSTTSLSFGSVSVNTPTTKTVTLTSSGTTAVTVNGATVSGTGFTLVGGSFPVTLNPNQTLTVTIQFLPTANGAQSGSVMVASDATGGSSTVTLGGTGTGAASEVDLSWEAPTSSPTTVVGYNIYRSTGSSGSFGVINSTPVAAVTYIDKAVASGTNYSYLVKSVDASGAESTASNQISLSIP